MKTFTNAALSLYRSYNGDSFRSSHRRCSIVVGVLKKFVKFTGKHLWKSFFFHKVAGLRPATLLKRRLWHRSFPVNPMKFSRIPFLLRNTSDRLLLFILKTVISLSVAHFIFHLNLIVKFEKSISEAGDDDNVISIIVILFFISSQSFLTSFVQ